MSSWPVVFLSCLSWSHSARLSKAVFSGQRLGSFSSSAENPPVFPFSLSLPLIPSSTLLCYIDTCVILCPDITAGSLFCACYLKSSLLFLAVSGQSANTRSISWHHDGKQYCPLYYATCDLACPCRGAPHPGHRRRHGLGHCDRCRCHCCSQQPLYERRRRATALPMGWMY